MELWIRSQDELALTKINSIGIEYDKKLVGYGNVCVKLGEYETKERALEVLDEIQSYLIPKLHHVCDRDLEGNNIKVLGIDSIQTMVYEMPKE